MQYGQTGQGKANTPDVATPDPSVDILSLIATRQDTTGATAQTKRDMLKESLTPVCRDAGAGKS